MMIDLLIRQFERISKILEKYWEKNLSQQSKEWVIVLTKDEKRTFYSFLSLYLGSSLLLFIVIAWLFYNSQAKQYNALTVSKMQINATNMAHIIIQSYMQNISLKKEDIHIMEGFRYGLYDVNKKPIYTQLNESIDFSKQYYKSQNKIDSFYVDKGALGHYGISYIVIKESYLSRDITLLFNNIIAGVMLLYAVIAVIGFYLAKLFIYPIQRQREKLNDFIKDTTHELNTPISALLLCVESNNFYTEQNREHIRISSKKISNLYKDLTYLFLSEQKQDKSFNHNIANILRDELTYHKQIAQKRKIIISYDIEDTYYKIQKDDFSRLVNNLLSNAIKYTKRNGEITVSFKKNILSIQDSGIGIEKDKIGKIFERYYRATDGVGGFGIGLNIVQSICKTYNISLAVHSEIGKGTIFTLNFN